MLPVVKVTTAVPVERVAPKLDTEATDPKSIFLSSTFKVDELRVVVIPFTVKFPLIVVVPDGAPSVKVVAAPNAFTVVATVLNTENATESVITDVLNVGLVDNTLFTVPVDVETPLPPFVTGKIPVTPVVNGKPIQLVNVPEDGVPNAGVTNVGLIANTNAPDPVSSDITPAS